MDSFADHTAAAIGRLDTSADLDGVGHPLFDHEVWHLRIADGTIESVAGAAPHADVTMRQDAATARALRAGELHAQHAFLTGRLVIDGDIAKLLEHGDLLGTLLAGGRA